MINSRSRYADTWRCTPPVQLFCRGLVLILVLGMAVPAGGQVVDERKLVDQVCIAYEENLARLRTWVAELEVRDQGWNTGLFERRDASFVVSMVYDRDLPAYRVDWRCIRSSGVQEGRSLPDFNTGNQTAELLAGDKLYRIPVYFAGKKSGEGKKGRTPEGPNIVTGEPQRHKPAGDFEERIVPRELLTYRGVPIPEKLQEWLRHAQQFPGVFQLEIASEGSRAIFRAKFGKNRETLVVDSARGGLLVASEQEGERVTFQQQVELTEVAGVWVPSRIRRLQQQKPSETGQAVKTAALQRFEREMVWRTNRVNEPVPGDLFTVDSLRSGRPATLTDFKTFSVTRLGEEDRRARPAATQLLRWRYGWVLMTVLPLGLLAWYAWRRWRR